MDKLFDQSDVADLDDKELEPVADEQWEQAAAAAEHAEPVLDAAALRRAGEEDRDQDDEDEDKDEEAAAASEGANDQGEGEGEDQGEDEDASDAPCAGDHACRGNDVRPGSCCLLNAPAAEPAAVMDEAAAAAAAREQLVAMAAAAVAPAAQEQLGAPAALAGEFAPVAVAAAAELVEGGQELSVGL